MLLNRTGGGPEREGNPRGAPAPESGRSEEGWGPRPEREAPPGRRSFRQWRRTRPFWAGLWTLLAGVELLSIPMAPLGLLVHEGVAGISGLLMGLFLVVLGLTLWLAPGYRMFAGIAVLIFAVASLILSNLGGFLIGFVLGVLGGAMAVSWVPDGEHRTRDRQRWNRRKGWTLIDTRKSAADGGRPAEGPETPGEGDGGGGSRRPPADPDSPRPGGATAARAPGTAEEPDSTLELPPVTEGPGPDAGPAAAPSAAGSAEAAPSR
ncbi:DUF6114 domain-containing protein [Streptomyces physcomitrii]|uniref:DUF6114 domain-containing protein n=1 Tax=Streptomyces physcomitrii TaxID=2724184 RepID=UPI00343D2821